MNENRKFGVEIEFLADLLRAGVIREARRGDERLAPEDLEALEAPEDGA